MKGEISMDVVTRIKLLAKEKHIKLRDIEQSLGYCEGTIRSWRKKRRQPCVWQIKEIAQYLNTPVDFLLGLTDISIPYPIKQDISTSKLTLVTAIFGMEMTDTQVEIILEYLDTANNFSEKRV